MRGDDISRQGARRLRGCSCLTLRSESLARLRYYGAWWRNETDNWPTSSVGDRPGDGGGHLRNVVSHPTRSMAPLQDGSCQVF